MGSEGHLSVPTINFSNSSLKPGTPEWDLVKSHVMKAAEDYGCFIASFDKLPVEARKGMVNELKDLFDLPVETKLQRLSTRPYYGYIGNFPNFENLEVGNPISLDAITSFVDMIWPEGRPSFSQNMQSFTKPILELDSLIKRIVYESLGVEKYLEELKDSTTYTLRVMSYNRPENGDEDQILLPAHFDKNNMTILYQFQGDGLEIEAETGDWIKIKPSHDSFVVMFGESFHAWTNGRVKPAYHRVEMTENQTRYSAGIFTGFDHTFTVKAPEELVDEEHPLLFKPYVYIDLIKQIQTELSRGSRYCFDAYRIA
ncbi:hypothetical protein K2173_024395 [Erythroxylum novogranatense]|uniref:Fe2OG dioxygenase domain-containing protein n=1 Tax=Erythroxylum novogranatense TaxID=1862640 RepID=A0AAV8SVA3_9ROSI|nr:hypothetical protein K2173_024395 [Erythroxylum novogranatense]